MFLLDGSDNTRNGFPEIKVFVKSIVDSLSVNEGQDRVSVVQFADNPEVSFYLNSHKIKNDIINAIDNLRHKGGRRLNIGEALQFVRHSVFTSSTGSRRLEGVLQMLILLSSKPSTDNVKSPAFTLKEHEIVSVGVGVGDANLSELEMIAFKPGFTYKVTDFSKLPSIKSQLIAALNIDTEETMTGISDLVGKNSTFEYMPRTGVQYYIVLLFFQISFTLYNHLSFMNNQHKFLMMIRRKMMINSDLFWHMSVA